MNISSLHKGFLTNRIILALTVIIFIIFRLISKENISNNAINFWAIVAIQISIAVFMLYLTQTFVIIRQRSLLPAFFYLLFTGTDQAVFLEIEGSIIAFGIAVCLFFLFSTYQNHKSQKEILNISLILSIISFFWFPALFLFPLFWYGMYRFQSLNLRTFLASLTGILIVYIFVFSWSVYKENLSLFTNLIPDFSNLWDFQLFQFSLIDWLVISLLLFLFILSGINIFMAGISEKVRTITTLRYLYLFALIVFILFIANVKWESQWVLIIYIPISYLFAHYFTFTINKWSSSLFLFTILFFISVFCITEIPFLDFIKNKLAYMPKMVG